MHCDVLLLQPPFGSIDMPSLGLSTIKAVLQSNKISSKVIYSNMLYARQLDQIIPGLYNRLCLVQSTSLAGEWVFASKAFNLVMYKNQEYLEGYSESGIVAPMLGEKVTIKDIEEARLRAEVFIEEIINYILTYKPKIVGLSSLFQQTCSSIAIAKALKKKIPKVITVLGGSNFLNPMGLAIKEITSGVIDYIFEGEAEFEFLDFCKRVTNEKMEGHIGERVIRCQPVMNLDSLPIPDYEDYFEQLKEYRIKIKAIKLPFESSRGCWWGQKTNCLFCGLNGTTIQYRRKSNTRIIQEMQYLTQKYNVQFLQATDNIMPKDLPSSLYSSYTPPDGLKTIYYEVKPTLNFEQLFSLENSAINSLQPGIESLNDHLLHLLRKGITGANNVRFLRDCKTLGIRTDWNLLYAIPGETIEDYNDIVRIIPKIHHLRPPDYIGPINIQRYSPLFNEPEKYGIKNVRPVKSYFHVFPKETNFESLALYFDGDFDTVFTGQIKEAFEFEINRWRTKWENASPPSLQVVKLSKDFYLVVDSRGNEEKIRVLTKYYYSILSRLREPMRINKAKNLFKIEGLEKYYKKLLDWDFVIEIGGRTVSLVCEPLRVLNNNR